MHWANIKKTHCKAYYSSCSAYIHIFSYQTHRKATKSTQRRNNNSSDLVLVPLLQLWIQSGFRSCIQIIFIQFVSLLCRKMYTDSKSQGYKSSPPLLIWTTVFPRAWPFSTFSKAWGTWEKLKVSSTTARIWQGADERKAEQRVTQACFSVVMNYNISEENSCQLMQFPSMIKMLLRLFWSERKLLIMQNSLNTVLHTHMWSSVKSQKTIILHLKYIGLYPNKHYLLKWLD